MPHNPNYAKRQPGRPPEPQIRPLGGWYKVAGQGMLQDKMMISSQDKTRPINAALRWTLLTSGFLATALGVLGIFLPIVPTVPFLLLAVACFARSSERFYSWLVDHAHFGPIVQPYIDGCGMSRASKGKAIVLLWTSIIFSAFLLVDLVWVRIILLVIACGVTFYLLSLPTLKVEEEENDL
jgi:uncharacterized membrane protein YbaN (DUF454 family)